MQTITTRDPQESANGLITASEATIQRLDRIREEGQSFDELLTELIDIYESLEWSIARAGDALE